MVLKAGSWSSGFPQTLGSPLCSLLQAVWRPSQSPACLLQPQRLGRNTLSSWSNTRLSPELGTAWAPHFGAWLPLSALGRSDMSSFDTPGPYLKGPWVPPNKAAWVLCGGRLGVDQWIALIMQITEEIAFQAEGYPVQKQNETGTLGETTCKWAAKLYAMS